MEGSNLRELVKRRGTGYRCIVEAVVDHKMGSYDSLTEIVRKGAQGVAYDFWNYSGNWWELAIAVEWERGNGCVYIEKYRKRNKIKKPITEIKFIREASQNERALEKNPLVEKTVMINHEG